MTKARGPAGKPTLTLKPGSVSRDISSLVRQHWPRLTEDEINDYRSDRQRFCNAVKQEYNLTQEEIDIQLNLMKRQALFAA